MKKVIEFAKRFWFLVPLLGLAITLMQTREKLADANAKLSTSTSAWQAERKAAAEQAKLDEKRWDQSHDLAVRIFDQQKGERDPIIVRARDTVKEYEKTDASRVQCLDADWVRRLQDNRAALFPQDTASAQGSLGTLSPH